MDNSHNKIPSSLVDYLNSLNQFKSNDRIESLYSDYSSTRQSNPAGFHSNNATWQIILTDLLRFGLQTSSKELQKAGGGATEEEEEEESPPDRLVLHLNDQLLESLRRPSIGKPYGLACPLWALSSLSTASSSAVLAPLNSFLSTGGWGPATGITTTMVRSISWASRAITRGTILDPDQRFDQLELDQKLNLVKIDWVNLLLLSVRGSLKSSSLLAYLHTHSLSDLLQVVKPLIGSSSDTNNTSSDSLPRSTVYTLSLNSSTN
jgi:charged multivesicular body protein 7